MNQIGKNATLLHHSYSRRKSSRFFREFHIFLKSLIIRLLVLSPFLFSLKKIRNNERERESVCVCVCVRERESVCVCERERERERVCVCVWERERESVCVCVRERERVCVCVRERESVCVCERERERESVCVCVCVRERERECVCVCVWERERERECVCVCVWERERERDLYNSFFALRSERNANKIHSLQRRRYQLKQEKQGRILWLLETSFKTWKWHLQWKFIGQFSDQSK